VRACQGFAQACDLPVELRLKGGVAHISILTNSRILNLAQSPPAFGPICPGALSVQAMAAWANFCKSRPQSPCVSKIARISSRRAP
jgi:hypothetical protein